MNDFFESLKDIKKELVKQEGKEPKKVKKPNPNQNEFKEIFKDKDFDMAKESIAARSVRLKDEFMEYVSHCDIKKI